MYESDQQSIRLHPFWALLACTCMHNYCNFAPLKLAIRYVLLYSYTTLVISIFEPRSYLYT